MLDHAPLSPSSSSVITMLWKVRGIRGGNVASQTRFAKSLYGDLHESAIEALKELLERQFSVLNGDLKYLESGWYVTHSGLLRLAKRRHCVGIHARLVPESSDPANSRWI